MRFTLDTVGKRDWPRTRQGRPVYPEGFEELAKKLERPLHPPGRDVRCIVSVGMLTEGWDCNTVTHIVGLRPFMSQLLCEQVVGRGLRRASYELSEDGQVQRGGGADSRRPVRGRPVQAADRSAADEGAAAPRPRAASSRRNTRSRFLGSRAISRRSAIGSPSTGTPIAPIAVDPMKVPDEVRLKATLLNKQGRPSFSSPGASTTINLDAWRTNHATPGRGVRDGGCADAGLRRAQDTCEAPAHVLFPQILAIVQALRPATGSSSDDRRSGSTCSSRRTTGFAIERLVEAIQARRLNRGGTRGSTV